MADKSDLEAVYYLDSCVLIDLIEHPATDEPAKTIAAILEDAGKGRFKVVTSVLTITEVLWAKEELDQHKISQEVESKIRALWHPASPIELVEVHQLISNDALKLLRDHIADGWSKTKGNDAIHLVTAKREGVTEFLTNGEQAMKKWGELLGFKISQPHYEPPANTGDEEGDLFDVPTQA